MEPLTLVGVGATRFLGGTTEVWGGAAVLRTPWRRSRDSGDSGGPASEGDRPAPEVRKQEGRLYS